MALQVLTRKFMVGRLILDDPCPTASIKKVHEIHCADYPQLRQTTVFSSDGVPEPIDGIMCIVYKYVLPPTSING